MLLKRALFIALMASGAAFAQQDLDISGKEFTAGAGDARLAEVGRQAAASGKRVVITAPQYWHSKIAAKVKAGAGAKADVVLKDGFYENVLVRVEDKPAEAPKPVAEPAPRPAPPPAARPQPTPPPAPAPTLRVEQRLEPTPAAVAPPPPPVATPAPPAAVQPPPPVQTAPVAAAPVKTTPASPPAAAPATAKAPDPAVAQKRFEQSLNSGRPAEGPIAANELAVNDLIYVDGSVRAVVRRDGLHTRLYWLEGDLDLRRAELKSIADDRYQVIEALRGGNVARRSDEPAAPQAFTAAVPGDKAPERTSLEKLYNDGRRINGTTTPERMKAGDILYTGKGAAVVIRREGNDLIRYWLEGNVNLNQHGLQKDGPAKYKVTSDIVR